MRFGISSSSEASGDEGPSSSRSPLYLGSRGDSRPKYATQQRDENGGFAGASSMPFASTSSNSLTATAVAMRRTSSAASTSASTARRSKSIVPPWIKRTDSGNSSLHTAGNGSESDGDDEQHQRRSVRCSRRPRSRSNFDRARSASLGIGALSDSSASALSSDEDNGNGGIDSDSVGKSTASDADTSDSEEIDWPVAPGRVGRGPRRSKRNQAAVRSVRLAADENTWGQEWVDAPAASWRSRATASRSIAPSKTLSPKAAAAWDDDFAQVESLLTNLRLEKEEAERKDRLEFEQREKRLWASIEEAIRKAEEDARQRAKEEADRLAAARKAQEEAERKAKAAKEAEQQRIKEEQEARERAKRDEEDRKQQDAVAAKRKQEEDEARERVKGMGGGDALRAQARLDYTKWTEKMKHIKENVLPVVSANATWRKQCFAAKRQITPKIGQLTNTQEEIWRITSLISSLLNEAKAAPAPNKEIYLWVLNHLSKCLIRQAEQEVSVKTDTAYPLARLVLWLILQGHAELGDVLMARLTKKCCWCLGYVPERRQDQDDAAFAKTVGRASPEESSVQFTSRISGIMAFYFAICQTSPISPPPPAGHSSPSPPDVATIPPQFRSSAMWTWQARCITPPMTSHAVIPALWATLIEVAGDTVLAYYGKQAAKIWRLLYEEGILKGKADFIRLEEGKAASGRLQLLLEDVIKTGKAEPPKGREMRIGG